MPEIVESDVLIAGAGPTGLTLACTLARHGVSFRIVEASPAPQTGSRGKGVQPRSLEVFDDLGIVDRIVARGAFAIGMLQHDENGQTTSAPRKAGPPRPDAPYTSSLLTPEWRVEEALRARLAEYGGQVTFGTMLASYTDDGETVTAKVTTADGEHTLRARWLVGCDGGKSTVRHIAGVSFAGETLETVRMFVGDVKLDGLTDHDHWHTWRSAEGFAALCPLPSTDEFQFQASVAPGQEDEPSLEAFQRVIDRRAGNSGIRLKEVGWKSLWRANVRMVDRYRVGRVILAGDAAHVHSPAGGQGMNTGIQDAYNLGWKLAAVLGGADATLIDTYQEERLPIAAWVLGVSNELMKDAIAARNLMIGRRDDTTQLGLGYRGRSLSHDTRPEGEGLRAGDRAPDAPGLTAAGGGTRIFDLLRGPHITLLGFGARWQPVIAAGATFGAAVRGYVITETEDTQGHARAAYGNDALFIIRPDNYVGMVMAEPNPAPVIDYLRRITPAMG